MGTSTTINWTPVSSHKELEALRSEAARHYLAGYVSEDTPNLPDGSSAKEYFKFVDPSRYYNIAVMGTDNTPDDSLEYEVVVTVDDSSHGRVDLWSPPIKDKSRAFEIADRLANAVAEDDFAMILFYTSLYDFESEAVAVSRRRHQKI